MKGFLGECENVSYLILTWFTHFQEKLGHAYEWFIMRALCELVSKLCNFSSLPLNPLLPLTLLQDSSTLSCVTNRIRSFGIAADFIVLVLLEGNLAPLLRSHKMSLYWCCIADLCISCLKEAEFRTLIGTDNRTSQPYFVFLQWCLLSELFSCK